MATLELDVVSNAPSVLHSIDSRLDSTSSRAEKLKKQFSSINFNNVSGSSDFKIPDYSDSIKKLKSALPDIIKMVSSMYTYFTEVNSKFEQMNILLTTATGNSKKGSEAFQQMIELSGNAPFSIDALTDSFVKLRSSGIEQAYEYTVRLSDSIAAFGGNSDKLKLVSVAIMQMAGKGVLSMEELKRQFGEQVPTALRLLETELKRTGKIAEDMSIQEAVSKKLVGSATGVEALMNALSRYSGTGSKVMDSYRGSIQLLSNQFQLLMYDIGQSNGSFKSISSAIFAAAEMIEKFRNSAEGAAVIEKIANNIAAGFNKITENPEVVYEFFAMVSSGAELASESLKYMITTLNYAMYVIENISGKTSSRSLTLLPDNFNMDQYSRIAPLLREYTELESKLGDQSRISRFLGGNTEGYSYETSLLDTLLGKGKDKAEDFEKNKKRLEELTVAIESGGSAVEAYQGKRKKSVETTDAETESVGKLVDMMGKNTSAEKEHAKAVAYYQNEREKAYQDYQEALSGAQSKEEEVRVLEKYKEVVNEINEKEAKSGRTAANKAEKDSLKELSAYIKSYAENARDAASALREWNSETSSILGEFNRMNEELDKGGMGEFESSVYDSQKALKENNKTIEEYQQKFSEVNDKLKTAQQQYDLVTQQIEKMKSALYSNSAGSDIQDLNKLSEMVDLQEDLKEQVEATTKSYFELYEANNLSVTSKEENARKIKENLKLDAYMSALSEIGMASEDMYNVMISGSEREKEAFIKASGDKEIAEEIFSRRILELERQRIEYVAKQTANYTPLLTAKLSSYYDELKAEAASFYEDFFPNVIGDSSSAIAQFTRDVAQSNKSISEAWSELGKTISDVVFDLLQDMTALYLKMSIMGTIDTGMSSGGGGIMSSLMSMFTWNAKGGTYNSPSLSEYSNSVVSSPTAFKFANGGKVGVMGEAGDEAILPLKRVGGDLGVKATVGKSNVNVVVNNNSTARANASVTESDGGFNIEVLVEAVEKSMQSRIDRGKPQVGRRRPWL